MNPIYTAIVVQNDSECLQVSVFGKSPDNFLYIVHEAISSLIAESYKGVEYDFKVPCPDCYNCCDVSIFPGNLSGF